MRRGKMCFIFLLLLASAVAIAQEAATMGPPKVLSITREEVKAGKNVAHDAYEARWTQAIKAKSNVSYLGLTATTGPNEAWWLTGYESFAAWEKETHNTGFTAVMDQFTPGDAEYVSGTRSIVAVYRPELSYNAPVKLGEMRYFNVRTVRVRPGQDAAYEEIRKLVNDARKKANVTDVHQAVYQIVSGAPNGTYLVFNPMKSAGEADAPPNAAYRETLGDDGRAKLGELAGKAILSSEDTLLAFNPKVSNPSPEMVAAAPDFWKPKPVVAKAKPAAEKKAATPAQ